MSSQKYTLTKNMDQQPLISEKISNQSSMKENYIWNMLGTISSSLISVILLLLASRLLQIFLVLHTHLDSSSLC